MEDVAISCEDIKHSFNAEPKLVFSRDYLQYLLQRLLRLRLNSYFCVFFYEHVFIEILNARGCNDKH